MIDDMHANNSANTPTTPAMNQSSSPMRPKNPAWKFFLLGVICMLIIAIVGSIFFVREAVNNLSEQPTVVKAARVLRVPVAKINGQSILYADYISDLMAVKKFQAKQGAPATDEVVSDQVLSRLIANAVIQKEAKAYGVRITDEDLAGAEAQLLSSFPDKVTAEQEIMAAYGWTINDYRDRVIQPILLEQKFAEVFTTSTLEAGAAYEEDQVMARHILITPGTDDASAKRKAETILRRVTTGKEDFATVAAEVSEDTSNKEQGGDLGWFGKGVMDQNFETAVFSIQPGQVGATVVKTPYGYHVVKVEDKRRARNFSAFIRDQITNAKIDILVPIHNPFADLQNVAPIDTATTTP